MVNVLYKVMQKMHAKAGKRIRTISVSLQCLRNLQSYNYIGVWNSKDCKLGEFPHKESTVKAVNRCQHSQAETFCLCTLYNPELIKP